MAMALIYPDAGERGRGKISDARKLADSAKFSYHRLNEARFILRELGEADAKSVLVGDTPFDVALKAATDKRDKQLADEQCMTALKRARPRRTQGGAIGATQQKIGTQRQASVHDPS